MNEITNFDFQGQKVRSMLIEGNPYFVGKDVTSILGYVNQETQYISMLMKMTP